MTPVFAVGDAGTAARLLRGKAVLISDAYVGTSWLKWEDLTTLLAGASLRLYDCGAFTRYNQAKKGKNSPPLSVEQWARRIVTVGGIFDHIISLDVIGDAEASLRNWTALLAEISKDSRADLHPKIVPVWHEGDPIEHLHAYDPKTRLVALGRTGGRKGGPEGKKCTFRFYDAAFNAYPKGRFHLLGNGCAETIEPYPAELFDATSWQRDSAYAQSHGWPWSAVSKETRMLAYIEAFESIRHRPRELPVQTSMFDAWEATI